jgi:RimJ/RimL family protein N-acetyltransferase
MSTATATIETERLTLRALRTDDCARVVALVGEWDVARMLGRIAFPYAEQNFLGWQATHAEARAKGTDFPFAIDAKDEGLVGCVGIGTGFDPGEARELGYWIGKPFWGRGYASEAGAALLHWAEAAFNGAPITARHFVENPASGRVLEKLGFKPTGVVKPSPCLARGHDVAARLMERTHLNETGPSEKDNRP